MPNRKQTSPAIVRKAAKALADPKTSQLVKSIAGSALSQAPAKPRGSKRTGR